MQKFIFPYQSNLTKSTGINTYNIPFLFLLNSILELCYFELFVRFIYDSPLFNIDKALIISLFQKAS